MMGAGKSTVGPLVADRLQVRFVDLDDEIERSLGCSIADVFAEHGEPWFRRHEAAALTEVLGGDGDAVVSLGGGAVVADGNRSALVTGGFVVWLRARVEVLAARVGTGVQRPLLGVGDPQRRLEALYEERGPLYEEVADAVVDVDGLDPSEVADLVVAAWRRAAGGSR